MERNTQLFASCMAPCNLWIAHRKDSSYTEFRRMCLGRFQNNGDKWFLSLRHFKFLGRSKKSRKETKTHIKKGESGVESSQVIFLESANLGVFFGVYLPASKKDTPPCRSLKLSAKTLSQKTGPTSYMMRQGCIFMLL